jgi:putative hemolysin
MLNFQNIVQRYFPEFASRHATLARVAGSALSFLFFQRRFEQFDREYPESEGFDFVAAAIAFFDFQLRVRESERVRIPDTGKVVIVANHPIGSLDGLALLHLIRQIRPDVKVVANNMLMQLPRLRPVLLPVDNMGGQTARKHLLAIKQHLKDESALLIFPAGEVSRFGAKGVRDPVWQSGFVKLASATKAPILPIFVGGRNSVFFYSLSFLAKPLSTAWLIREMFKQSHNTIDARIGRAIPYEVYSANTFSAVTLASMFKQHVYRLAKHRKPIFDSVETVATPESPVLMKREVSACEHLGATPDGKLILLTTARQSPCIMREIGRLREMTFRLVGEGSGAPQDIDRFDQTYDQLFLWDVDELEIVGAYRLGDARSLIQKGGISALYTNTLFDFGPSMHAYFAQGLELGRSFVQPKYQTRNALDYLWYGIGAYVSKRPHIRYLFGATSISRFYSPEAIARIAHFFSENYIGLPVEVHPRTPFTISDEIKEKLNIEFFGIDRDEDFKALKHYLALKGLKVPTLYKHYSQTTEHTGVTFCAFNRDPDFSDCVDGFVIADLTLLKPKKKARYLGQNWPYDAEQS